ncbi:hypothetical protein Tco_1183531 [Tanacetum coccineum]
MQTNETLYSKHGATSKELLMKYPQHHLTKMQEVILFYNGLDVPIRQILDSRGVVPTKTAADAKKAIQEMAEYSQKGTMEHLEEEDVDNAKDPHYTKDCPLKEERKTLEEAYYTQFGGPFQGGGYRATALGFYQRNNANPSYQERRKSMEDTLSKFMGESAKRHEENSNFIKEIQASTNVAIRNQGASIKTLEIQIKQMSKKGSYGTQFSEAYSKASHTDESIPQKEKDPGSFTLPCFINMFCFENVPCRLGSSLNVMPLLTTLT